MINVEEKLLMYYPKYDSLVPTNEYFDPRTREFDIYIDIGRMINSVYKPETSISRISQEKYRPLIIVSSIINLCAHLRSYYRKAFSAESRIFLVYSSGEFPYSRKFFENYNLVNIQLQENDQYKVSIVKQSIKLLNTLIPYIPKVYLSISNFEIYVKMYDIILKEYNENPIIIFTKENLDCLLASELEQVLIFNHIKGRNERVVVGSKDNIIETYYAIDKRKINEDNLRKLRLLNPSLLSTMIAFTGYKKKGIFISKSLNETVSMLYDLIDKGNIPNDYCVPNMIFYNLVDKKNINEELIENIWKSIDLKYQYELYKNSYEYSDMSYKNDINDPKELHYINDHYFVNNPLDLQRL